MTDHHHGSLAHPLEDADHGVRGGKMIHEPGEEGETATVSCGTTKGEFVAKFHRDWSPHGYDRATALFQKGYYDNSHFFRVVPKFLVQFGISYTQDKSLKQFANTQIPDDPQLEPKMPFQRGTMAFAGSGPNSRTSQMFISYGRNPGLGKELWETPFGEVIEGMEHIEELYSYGDMPPWGKGPVQGKIHNDPNYIPNEFPLLDKFEKCTVIVHKPGDFPLAADGKEVDDQGEGESESGDMGEEKSEESKEEEDDEEEEEGDDEEEAAAQEHRNRGLPRHAGNTDDSIEPKHKSLQRGLKSGLKSAQDALSPFEDFLQLGIVVAAIIALVLGVAAISRKTRKKKHAH